MPRAHVARAGAGPALEGARKGRRIGEAEAIGRVLDRQAFAHEAEGEAPPQPVQQLLVGDPLGLEPAVQGLAAVAEVAGETLYPDLARREQRFESLLDLGPERARPGRRLALLGLCLERL